MSTRAMVSILRLSLLLLLVASVTEAHAAAATLEREASATLLFAGDIMLAETGGELIAKGIDPFQGVAEILKSADVRVGNLECVVSTIGSPMKGKPFTFQAHPRVLPVVGRHFDVVSLANNHTGDFGHEAFVQQLDLLNQQHLAHFGGGRTINEARTPKIVEIKGLRIALLGYNDFMPREFEAGPSWPGIAWCVPQQIKADIHAARTIHHADLVIPFLHWGDEHEPANERQRKLAHLMIDAGADVVVGGHPHVTQATEYYHGKLIAYSLGNFVFNGFKEGPARLGWMLRLHLDKQGLTDWNTITVHLDDDGSPQLVKGAISPAGNARAGTITGMDAPQPR